MTPDQKRRFFLISVMIALVALVAADRLGVFGGADGDAAGGGTAMDEWLSAGARASDMQAEVDQGPEWEALLASARGSWESVADELIVAPSAEVASARLRRRVQEAMGEFDLRLTVSEALPPRAPVDGEPLRIVGIELSFDALNPEQVYRLIDRLEHLDSLRTNIPTLRIEGPGRGVRTGIQVTMSLQALAMVETGRQS